MIIGVIRFNRNTIFIYNTAIMYQHTTVGHKIRMEALNIEVIDADRRFQEFVLYLFNDDILAVNQYKDISRPQMNRVPASTLADRFPHPRPRPDRQPGFLR